MLIRWAKNGKQTYEIKVPMYLVGLPSHLFSLTKGAHVFRSSGGYPLTVRVLLVLSCFTTSVRTYLSILSCSDSTFRILSHSINLTPSSKTTKLIFAPVPPSRKVRSTVRSSLKSQSPSKPNLVGVSGKVPIVTH